MTKSTRRYIPISPVPFAPPSKSGKANGSSSRSSGRSTTAHSWQATSRPPTGTTRPNTRGISPSCCARRPAFVRGSTPTTSKSSRRSDLHHPYNPLPCSRHRNPMAGFLCPSVNRPVSFRTYKLPCADYPGLWRVYSSLILRFAPVYTCVYNSQSSLFVSFIVIASEKFRHTFALSPRQRRSRLFIKIYAHDRAKKTFKH